MSTLTYTCIGHNEADHLQELLPSLIANGDEVIYVDCDSSDDSCSVAARCGCKVFKQPNNMNLNVNKSFAINQANSEWIFYIDPDERLSTELFTEIKQSIASQQAYSGFKLARRNHYFGHWLRYGGQYPDTQLRLFRKGAGKFANKHVHERLEIAGRIGRLQHDMLHYPYLTISQFIKKFDFYTSFEAEYLAQGDSAINFNNSCKYLVAKPLSRFLRRYFLKLGFRDGMAGFFAALFDALGWMTRYFKLWEIRCRTKLNNHTIR